MLAREVVATISSIRAARLGNKAHLMMRDDWTAAARRELLDQAGREGGWAYRRGAAACAEPTALAGLALLATRNRGDAPALQAAGDWLASLQRPDGSVGVSRATSAPGWMTPHALLFWRALGSHAAQSRNAATWLLGEKGRTISRSEDPGHVAGHDTTLVGWPWVAGTHSWLEPTAMAVLALGRAGLGEHPRVQEGLRLIRDRAVRSGGWNYGNKAVFDRPLRAQPGPTGLALLTLAGIDQRGEIIARAIGYLREALPGVRASASLGWGVVGLRAWGERPEGWDVWLAESYSAVAGRPDAAPGLACLLLASGEGTLELFGRQRGS
jgi:hypothetical protein